MDRTRDHDAARRRFRLQPGGDVHAIAVEVIAIDDQVAQVQAHAEHEAQLSAGMLAVGLGHGLLELDSGAQRIDCAGELDQSPVAGQLDQTPSVFRQNRIEGVRRFFRRRASVPLSSRPIRRE